MCNDNYPPGAANDPNAPYNQRENDPIEVEVDYSISLFKPAVVETTNYETEEWEDYDFDGVEYSHNGGVDYIPTESDFRDEYNEQHMTPVQLIDRFKSILEKLRDGEEIKLEKGEIKYLIEECSDWEEQDDECLKA